MEAIVYLLAVHIDLIASAGKVWFPLTNISFVIYKRLKQDFFLYFLWYFSSYLWTRFPKEKNQWSLFWTGVDTYQNITAIIYTRKLYR